ncbi:MAG: hypothetical protein ACI81P_003612, partial [Neolewinella sp.]
RRSAVLKVSGDYTGYRSKKAAETVFDNGFMSQVFLNRYCSENQGHTIWSQPKDGEKTQLTEPFSPFIARMRKEPDR